MNIQQLEYVVALDEHRHFVSAAESCNVTQPTLTMQLKKLEEELGILIFDRTKKPIKPTPVGEEFISRARSILRDLAELKRSVTSERSLIEGEFRLAIIPTLAPHLLPLFLGYFTENNPGTTLRITELESELIIKALHSNRIDMAIMATPTEESDLSETLLFYEPFIFYAPLSHLLLKEKKISSELLDASDLLLLSEGHCFRSQALSVCDRKTKDNNPGFHYNSGSIETLKSLVKKGFGYTLIPELSVDKKDAANVRRFYRPEPVREISVVTHISFSRTLIVEKVKEAVRATLPQHIVTPKEHVMIKWR